MKWVKKLVASKAGTVAQVLLSLVLLVSIGAIVGIIIWEAIEGTVSASPKVFVAAIVGAAASAIGFGLFALVLSLFGPILSAVCEEWTAYVAPAIGGTVGAAISGGLTNVIYLVALSALTGGIVLLVFGTITGKERVTFNGISELVIAGVGFGAVNGVIVVAVFKVLEVTLGIDWLVAG